MRPFYRLFNIPLLVGFLRKCSVMREISDDAEQEFPRNEDVKRALRVFSVRVNDYQCNIVLKTN